MLLEWIKIFEEKNIYLPNAVCLFDNVLWLVSTCWPCVFFAYCSPMSALLTQWQGKCQISFISFRLRNRSVELIGGTGVAFEFIDKHTVMTILCPMRFESNVSFFPLLQTWQKYDWIELFPWEFFPQKMKKFSQNQNASKISMMYLCKSLARGLFAPETFSNFVEKNV